MRTIHWLYLITIVLLVAGAGLFVASARTAKPPPPVTPAASLQQIMNGTINPAATVVFKSVATVITAAGTEERAPKTDAEWERVAKSAAVLVESGNLLLIRRRIVNQDEWVKRSRALIDAATVALDAARAKDAEAVFASGEALYLSCDSCHQRFMN